MINSLNNYFFCCIFVYFIEKKKFPEDHFSMEKHNENKMNKMFKTF